MDKRLARCLAQGAEALADDALSAAQLETFLASASVPPSQQAWQRSPIYSRNAWLRDLWQRLGRESLLLGSGQARALWSKIVAENEESTGVVHTEALAAAAQRAWTLLLDWDVDPATQLARPGESSFAAFLRWADRYRVHLQSAGWLDSALVTARIRDAVTAGTATSGDLLIVDNRTPHPAFDRLLSVLRDVGVGITTWRPDNASVHVGQLALADRREELDAALSWACERLYARPTERIAIIAAAEPGVEAAVRRWFASSQPSEADEDTVPMPGFTDRAMAIDEPMLGAALDCLQLLGSASDFVTLSRVLRSPFLSDKHDEHGLRAILETELRSVLSAQADFPSAFRNGGLARRIRARVPQFERRLANALETLDSAPRFQSATLWAQFMDQMLRVLGWQGASEAAPTEAIELWTRVTTEFCGLTPILGELSYDHAVAQLERVLRRTKQPIELPIAGISFFSSIEQVGPGYDAAWSTGMSDRLWPRSAQMDDLLPSGLQRAHRMPFASPEMMLDLCRRQTADLIARVPDVVFSYPQTIGDEPAGPSPLIKHLGRADISISQRFGHRGRLDIESNAWLEVVEDPVPPLSDRAVPGGARTIELQAQCPLQAFIEGRLRAQPLDRPERGVGPRLRGVLVHRALELFYGKTASRAALATAQAHGVLTEQIAESVDRALADGLRVAGRAQRALRDLERRRLESLVAAMVNRDLERDDFEIDSLELREKAEIGGVGIRCRIDRVDRLADGRLAIIDYKTGRNVSASGLLTARLRAPQLPLYSLVLAEAPAALAYVSLQPRGATFRGIWEPSDVLPGRPAKLPPDRDWDEQRQLWRDQLAGLVEEFVAGDGRVFLDSVAAVRDRHAALSRALEIETSPVGGAIGGGV
jgi:ATP-dependent helicase/nuclease subunit B